MVAVSMSVFIGGWIGAFELALNGYFEQFGSVDLTIIEGSPFLDRSHVPMSPATMDRVSRLPGVRIVQPVRTIEQRLGGRPFTLSATDTNMFFSETARRGKQLPIVDGAPVSPGDLTESPRIMISEAAAHNLRLHVGDHVTLHAPKEDVSFEVRAIMVDYSSPSGSGYIDRRFLVRYWGDEAIDAINVGLAEGASADAVSDRIRAELGSAVFVTHTDAVRQNLADTLADSFSYAHTVEIVTLLVALMGVIGTMIAAVIDRSREIGTLRAIGATRRQVGSAVVIEAGFLGVCAVVAGIALGVLLGLLFLKTLMLAGTGWQLHFVFPWSSAARIGGLAIATSMAAGGIAASRISASDDLGGSVAYE
jgi:putative ABC transport system permease protein